MQPPLESMQWPTPEMSTFMLHWFHSCEELQAPSQRPAAANRLWTGSSSLQISSPCVADKITTLKHTQLASNLAESCVDTNCQCSPTQRQVGLVVKSHMRQRSQFDTLNCDGWWRTIPQMKAIDKNLWSMQCRSAILCDKGHGQPTQSKASRWQGRQKLAVNCKTTNIRHPQAKFHRKQACVPNGVGTTLISPTSAEMHTGSKWSLITSEPHRAVVNSSPSLFDSAHTPKPWPLRCNYTTTSCCKIVRYAKQQGEASVATKGRQQDMQNTAAEDDRSPRLEM